MILGFVFFVVFLPRLSCVAFHPFVFWVGIPLYEGLRNTRRDAEELLTRLTSIAYSLRLWRPPAPESGTIRERNQAKCSKSSLVKGVRLPAQDGSAQSQADIRRSDAPSIFRDAGHRADLHRSVAEDLAVNAPLDE